MGERNKRGIGNIIAMTALQKGELPSKVLKRAVELGVVALEGDTPVWSKDKMVNQAELVVRQYPRVSTGSDVE